MKIASTSRWRLRTRITPVSTRGGRAGITRCSAYVTPKSRRCLAAEGGVRRERLVAGRFPVEHAAQLAPARDPEVEGSSDSLGREREAMAGRVADEEAAVLDRGPEAVRDQVALVADGRHAEPRGGVGGRLLHRDARVVRGCADSQLVSAPGRASSSRAGRASGR